jgi:hypothetical protein
VSASGIANTKGKQRTLERNQQTIGASVDSANVRQQTLLSLDLFCGQTFQS